METINHTPNFKSIFSDKRLDSRAEKIASLLIHSRNCSIKGSTHDEASQKGFYRFLENDNVQENHLITELTQRCGGNVQGRNILCIQDTSSIGLSDHRNHLKKGSGVGLVGNKNGLGFLLHCSLVIDAVQETMLGFSDVHLWHRQTDKSNNTTRMYKGQPIEEKESYRWIQAGVNSKQVLEQAKTITIIEDREGDIYEQWCTIPDHKTHLLVRNRDNRRLSDGTRLHEELASAPLAGTYTIEIFKDLRKQRKQRTATLEVRFKKIHIQKPAGIKTTELANQLALYAVEAREVNGPQSGLIKWRLLTTHPVTCFEEAMDIINMYRQRWYVEQLFRLLKKQGFQIEDSELSSGWAIRKLTVLLLNNILRVMQLLMAYNNEESQDTEEVFSKQEVRCLEMLGHQFNKEGTKVMNYHSPAKLSWASWIVARLGGWKGYEKQTPPGPITMKRGIEKFDLIFQGWILAKQMQKDVSTR